MKHPKWEESIPFISICGIKEESTFSSVWWSEGNAGLDNTTY
jgi:hypothetical protein